MTGRRRLVAAAVLVLGLAGCGSTVAGRGSYGGTASSGGGTAAPGGGSPTPGPNGSPGRTVLSCAGGTVLQPANAPYCYLLPAGFKDVSALTRTTVGQSGEHPTSIAVAGDDITQDVRDLIIVLDFTLRLDTDSLSDQDLVRQLDTLIGQFEAQGFTFDTRVPGRASVDGARGFTYHARAREGYLSDLVFAFRGRQEVELNCQYKAHQAAIRGACGTVLASLQIARPR